MLSNALEIDNPSPLPEGCNEFDSILLRASKRKVRNYSIALSAVAAVIAVIVFLFRSPSDIEKRQSNSIDIINQIRYITSIDPSDACKYDFRPVGDGFIMTAEFPDGSSASYIITPMEDDCSFHLISLNE